MQLLIPPPPHAHTHTCTPPLPLQCSAGVRYPFQDVAAGTLCYNGYIVHDWDPACRRSNATGGNASFATASVTPTPDPLCPRDGLYCDSQCGSYFYQCWGGSKGPLQAVAAGTRCYSTTATGALDPNATSAALAYGSAVLVHENDVHCLTGTPCDPEGGPAPVLRCYYPPAVAGASPTPRPACASSYYLCAVGVPSQILDVALGTACLNGTIVHANDPGCRRSGATGSIAALEAACGVRGSLRVGGLSASDVLHDPTVSGALAAVLAACATGNCSEAVTTGSATAAAAGVPTAADCSFANVTDPSVKEAAAAAGGGGGRRSLAGGRAGGRLRGRGAPAEPEDPLLTFSEPLRGGGLPQPLSIDPRLASSGRSPRFLSWIADSAASAYYTPPGPPTPSVPVIPRGTAVGALGVGTAQFNFTIVASTPERAAAMAAALTAALVPNAGGESNFSVALGNAQRAAAGGSGSAGGSGLVVTVPASATAFAVFSATVAPSPRASPAPQSLTSSALPQIGESPTPAPATASAGDSPSGLSAGAIAGIAVAATLGAALVATVAVLVARGRSQHRLPKRGAAADGIVALPELPARRSSAATSADATAVALGPGLVGFPQEEPAATAAAAPPAARALSGGYALRDDRIDGEFSESTGGAASAAVLAALGPLAAAGGRRASAASSVASAVPRKSWAAPGGPSPSQPPPLPPQRRSSAVSASRRASDAGSVASRALADGRSVADAGIDGDFSSAVASPSPAAAHRRSSAPRRPSALADPSAALGGADLAAEALLPGATADAHVVRRPSQASSMTALSTLRRVSAAGAQGKAAPRPPPPPAGEAAAAAAGGDLDDVPFEFRRPSHSQQQPPARSSKVQAAAAGAAAAAAASAGETWSSFGDGDSLAGGPHAIPPPGAALLHGGAHRPVAYSRRSSASAAVSRPRATGPPPPPQPLGARLGLLPRGPSHLQMSPIAAAAAGGAAAPPRRSSMPLLPPGADAPLFALARTGSLRAAAAAPGSLPVGSDAPLFALARTGSLRVPAAAAGPPPAASAAPLFAMARAKSRRSLGDLPISSSAAHLAAAGGSFVARHGIRAGGASRPIGSAYAAPGVEFDLDAAPEGVGRPAMQPTAPVAWSPAETLPRRATRASVAHTTTGASSFLGVSPAAAPAPLARVPSRRHSQPEPSRR